MSIKNSLNKNPKLKKLLHWLIVRPRMSRPRLWVRLFLTPIIHSKSSKSKVSLRARLDLFPFNKFQLQAKSVIESFSVINNGVGDVIIGQNTFIGISNVIIGPVKIGNNCIFAQNVVLSGLNHRYENIDLAIRDQETITKQISIGDDCWIGSNAVITAGVNIGKHVVVAAGSVVTKDVADFCVVGGNPAKVIKAYNSETKNWRKS
jgi:acetyltransferase-like isoleucine patch superfamily enzyme